MTGATPPFGPLARIVEWGGVPPGITPGVTPHYGVAPVRMYPCGKATRPGRGPDGPPPRGARGVTNSSAPFSSSAASGPRPPGRGPAVCPAADPVAVLVRVHTAELLPRRRRVGRPHARLGRVPRRAIPHQHITELGRQDGHPCGAPVPPAGVATFAHARAHAWAVTISRPRPAWTPTPRRSRGAATTTTRARASRPTGIVASSNHDHDASRSPPPLSRVGVESLASSSVRAAGVAGAGVAAAGGPPLLFFT